MYLALVVLCATALSLSSASYPYFDTQDFVYNVPKVYRVSLALDKLLDYYERKPSKDPEWYIALGIARGHVEYTMNQLDRTVPQRMREVLSNLTRRMERVNSAGSRRTLLYRSKAYEYVARSTLESMPVQAGLMRPLGLGALRARRPLRTTFQQYLKQAAAGTPTRDVADSCTMKLLVSAMEAQNVGAQVSCELSPDCHVLMTQGSALAFQMTSRLRTTQLAKTFDCMEKSDLDTQIFDMCDKIYKETQSLEAWEFPVGTNTLFMQQIFYCSLQGYGEFIKPRWMNMIISWQRPKGCFADERQTFQRLSGYTGKEREGGAGASPRELDYRRKQVAASDGITCNSLTSAMALGSLVVYVRALLESSEAFQNSG